MVSDHADSVAERLDGEARLRQMIDAVRGLPKAQRQVVQLCLLGDLTIADAAALLKVAEVTVRSHLSRARATVAAGIARPALSRGRVLAVAAAVVLLVAGAAVGTQVFRSRPAEVPAGSAEAPAGSDDLATRTLDRCWARTAGKTDRVPARATWVTTYTAAQGDDVVVAFTAVGKPMFCEATSTTVTLSDPDATPAYAPGSRTGLLLYTGTGLVAGVADPAWANGATASSSTCPRAAGASSVPPGAPTASTPCGTALALARGRQASNERQ